MEDYYKQLCSGANFLATKNSYERYNAYCAIERYNDEHGQEPIKCYRVHKYITIKSPMNMCFRHRERLTGACSECSDPWCYGPFCPYCPEDPCPYAIEMDDPLPAFRAVIGLNILKAPDNAHRPKTLRVRNIT